MKDNITYMPNPVTQFDRPSGPAEMSIIVISYNTRDMTLECLASIYEQTRTPFEVIVVDNASSDGSAEAIAEQFPDVHLIAETTNHGFAPAHNIAIRHCTSPWILLLNPDTIVLDGALDNLLDFAKRTPDAKIWGGRTLFADGSLNTTSCWRKMSLWTVFCRVTGLTGIFSRSPIFNAEEYAGWARDSEAHVDIVTGCLFLLQRETWDMLGGFDPTFTMYGEEADLCMRARTQLHARPMITPKAEIIHYGGASEKVPADRIIRVIRAKAELIQRHFSPWTRKVGLWLFRLFPLSRTIANKLAGALTGREDLKENGRIWEKVWKRRAEWQNGFPKK